MRYTVRKSIVRIVGHLWQPGRTASMVITLRDYDVQNIKAQAIHDRGKRAQITRDDVAYWLSLNSGDFQQVIDFDASIEVGDHTRDFPWSSDAGECAYLDTLPEDY